MRRLLLLVVGLLAAVRSNAFASSSLGLKEADSLIQQAQSLGLSPAAQRKSLEARCLSGMAHAELMEEARRLVLDNSLSDDLRQYHECEAFSRRDPGLCDALARFPFSRQKDMVPRCRTSYIRSSVIALNVTKNPKAAEACRALPLSEDDLYQTTLEKECSWMTTPALEERCRNPSSPPLEIFQIKDCLAHHVYHADKRRCAMIERAPLPQSVLTVYRKRCRDAAAYRRAYRSRNAALCGDSLACRMLMGESVCPLYRERFRGKFCELWARRKVMEGLLTQISAVLERPELQRDSDWAARQNMYEALRKNFAESFGP